MFFFLSLSLYAFLLKFFCLFVCFTCLCYVVARLNFCYLVFSVCSYFFNLISFMSVCLSCLFFYFFLNVCLSFFLNVCLSFFLNVCLSFFLNVYFCFFLYRFLLSLFPSTKDDFVSILARTLTSNASFVFFP